MNNEINWADEFYSMAPKYRTKQRLSNLFTKAKIEERERIIELIETLINSENDWNMRDLLALLKQLKGEMKL